MAALLYAQGRTIDSVKSALVDTARTPGVGTGAFTTAYGHGIVDAAAATAEAGGTVTATGGKGRGKNR